MSGLCARARVYTCNLLAPSPPLPRSLLIADYSQTLKYTRLRPAGVCVHIRAAKAASIRRSFARAKSRAFLRASLARIKSADCAATTISKHRRKSGRFKNAPRARDKFAARTITVRGGIVKYLEIRGIARARGNRARYVGTWLRSTSVMHKRSASNWSCARCEAFLSIYNYREAMRSIVPAPRGFCCLRNCIAKVSLLPQINHRLPASRFSSCFSQFQSLRRPDSGRRDSARAQRAAAAKSAENERPSASAGRREIGAR